MAHQLDDINSQGKPVKVPYNAFGQPLSDADGNPTKWKKYYEDMHDAGIERQQDIQARNAQAQLKAHQEAVVTPVAAPVAIAAPPVITLMEPPAADTPGNNKIRVALIDKFGFDPAASANLPQRKLDDFASQMAKGTFSYATNATAPPVIRPYQAPISEVSAPPALANTAPPVIQPGPSLSPVVGYVRAAPVGVTDAEKSVQDMMDKNIPLKAFVQATPTIQAFQTATQASQSALSKGSPTIATDKELGRVVYNLYKAAGGQGGGARSMAEDFKGEELGSVDTLPEKIRGAYGLLLRNEALTPEGRTRLIQEGNRYTQALEISAKPGVDSAVAAAMRAGRAVNPDVIFGPPGSPVRNIAEGKPSFSAPLSTPGTSIAPKSTVVGQRQIDINY
jgi:hypothetical protein